MTRRGAPGVNATCHVSAPLPLQGRIAGRRAIGASHSNVRSGAPKAQGPRPHASKRHTVSGAAGAAPQAEIIVTGMNLFAHWLHGQSNNKDMSSVGTGTGFTGGSTFDARDSDWQARRTAPSAQLPVALADRYRHRRDRFR